MLALVVLEAAAIGLLGVLVAGLLRSHAEILRRLHHLGAGLDPGDGAGPRLRRPPIEGVMAALEGETPSGQLVRVALDRPGERVLLLFLSSGCGTCAPWWEGLRMRAHEQVLPGVRTVVVARDRVEESPSRLAGLAPPDVAVVLSSPAWETFAVPGSPYAVLIDGGAAAVMGQGVASSWEQLGSLVGQHLDDIHPQDGRRPRDRERRADGRDRERRADAELLAAGIQPGHPSLHPEPGSWTGPTA